MMNKMIYSASLSLALLSALTFAQAAPMDSNQMRIQMLETALAPETPKQTALLWAIATRQRNGAVQYMLMCPDQQQAQLKNLQDLNWVTGTSSSSMIKGQDVKSVTQQGDHYIAELVYIIPAMKKGSNISDTIEIKALSDQKWCVSSFKSLSPL